MALSPQSFSVVQRLLLGTKFCNLEILGTMKKNKQFPFLDFLFFVWSHSDNNY